MNGKRSASKPRRGKLPEVFSPDVRIAPLLSIPLILAELGLDPPRVIAEAGVDPRLFADPEGRIPFAALGRLVETCVERTNCPHFGLLIGERFRLDSLGILGSLMRNSPTLRDALRMAALNLEIHDRGALSLALDVGGSRSLLGYSLLVGTTPAAGQILDGALAMQYRMLKELCGASWKPVLVQLSRRRPENVDPWRSYFGASIEFDAPLSALVFESQWLEHPIPGANPTTYSDIIKQIESMMPRETRSFAAQVRRGTYALVFTGSASSKNLARLFNLHQRTLRRRLDEEGTTVRELVNEVRCELSHHFLRDTDLTVAQISAALHYSDGTVFARAFRGWSNMSPREWRMLHAVPDQARARHPK